MMRITGQAAAAGQVGLLVNRGQRPLQVPFSQVLKRGLPNKKAVPAVNQWRRANMMNLLRGAHRVWTAEKLGLACFYGALYLDVWRPLVNVDDLLKEFCDPYVPGRNFVLWAQQRGIPFAGLRLGLASTRVVTDVGVGYIVDSHQNSVELENMKYHGLGTGSTAEAAGDTALVTELTTEYTGNVRATGSTTEGATANIFRSVGTNTLDETPGAALREHGIFSAASAGVLLDRTVYAAITLSSGDSLAATYDLTYTSGS